MSKWIKSSFRGVRYREHPTRKHGLQRDRYYSIRIKLNGKDKEEGLGWASEWKASTSEIKENLQRGGDDLPSVLTEQTASEIRAKLQTAKRYGVGAVTLAERRAKAEAERKIREEEQTQQARDAMSFVTYFTLNYVPHAAKDKKELSHKRELGLFNKWISDAIGHRPIKDIGVVDLERLKQRMAKGNMKPRTIEYALAVVRQTFNHARRTGFYSGESPTTLVKKPKVNNARLRYLDQHEVERLLKELETMPDVHDMSLVSLHCGLRFGEIAALSWSNVDISRGIMTLLDTKHGDRQVPMTARVKAMFEQRHRSENTGLVFPKPIRGGIRPDIGKYFRDAVERSELNAAVEDDRQKCVFHTLRHTFASWHVLAGTDLYTLGKLMGHKTPTMTARYGHLSPEGAVRATRAFEALMEQQDKTAKVVHLSDGTA